MKSIYIVFPSARRAQKRLSFLSFYIFISLYIQLFILSVRPFGIIGSRTFQNVFQSNYFNPFWFSVWYRGRTRVHKKRKTNTISKISRLELSRSERRMSTFRLLICAKRLLFIVVTLCFCVSYLSDLDGGVLSMQWVLYSVWTCLRESVYCWVVANAFGLVWHENTIH